MNQNRGFSLLELTIASALVSLMLVTCFSVATKASTSFKEMVHESQLTDVGQKTIKFMQEDLADSTRLQPLAVTTNGVTFNNAGVSFKVPLQYVHAQYNPKGHAVFMYAPVLVTDISTGQVVNPPTFTDDYDFRLTYGWRDKNRTVPNSDTPNAQVPLQGPGLNTPDSYLPTGMTKVIGTVSPLNVTPRTPDGYICYRFQADPNASIGRYGSTGKFVESVEKIDIDGDGLLNSAYIVGYIERSLFLGAPGAEQILQSSRTAICDSYVLQPYPAPAVATTSATAGAMKTNNIFFPTPGNSSRLEVFLWVMQMGQDGLPHVMRCSTNEFLRNNAAYVTSASATGTN